MSGIKLLIGSALLSFIRGAFEAKIDCEFKDQKLNVYYSYLSDNKWKQIEEAKDQLNKLALDGTNVYDKSKLVFVVENTKLSGEAKLHCNINYKGDDYTTIEGNKNWINIVEGTMEYTEENGKSFISCAQVQCFFEYRFHVNDDKPYINEGISTHQNEDDAIKKEALKERKHELVIDNFGNGIPFTFETKIKFGDVDPAADWLFAVVGSNGQKFEVDVVQNSDGFVFAYGTTRVTEDAVKKNTEYGFKIFMKTDLVELTIDDTTNPIKKTYQMPLLPKGAVAGYTDMIDRLELHHQIDKSRNSIIFNAHGYYSKEGAQSPKNKIDYKDIKISLS